MKVSRCKVGATTLTKTPQPKASPPPCDMDPVSTTTSNSSSPADAQNVIRNPRTPKSAKRRRKKSSDHVRLDSQVSETVAHSGECSEKPDGEERSRKRSRKGSGPHEDSSSSSSSSSRETGETQEEQDQEESSDATNELKAHDTTLDTEQEDVMSPSHPRGRHRSEPNYMYMQNSLLEEVLTQKKLSLMKSPEVIRWLQQHQAALREKAQREGEQNLQQQSTCQQIHMAVPLALQPPPAPVICPTQPLAAVEEPAGTATATTPKEAADFGGKFQNIAPKAFARVSSAAAAKVALPPGTIMYCSVPQQMTGDGVLGAKSAATASPGGARNALQILYLPPTGVSAAQSRGAQPAPHQGMLLQPVLGSSSARSTSASSSSSHLPTVRLVSELTAPKQDTPGRHPPSGQPHRETIHVSRSTAEECAPVQCHATVGVPTSRSSVPAPPPRRHTQPTADPLVVDKKDVADDGLRRQDVKEQDSWSRQPARAADAIANPAWNTTTTAAVAFRDDIDRLEEMMAEDAADATGGMPQIWSGGASAFSSVGEWTPTAEQTQTSSTQ